MLRAILFIRRACGCSLGAPDTVLLAPCPCPCPFEYTGKGGGLNDAEEEAAEVTRRELLLRIVLDGELLREFVMAEAGARERGDCPCPCPCPDITPLFIACVWLLKVALCPL